MNTPFRLHLPRHFLEAMLDQARAELPNECCGLLAGTIEEAGDGRLGRVVKRYPLVNELASPTEFLSEPKILFQAHRDMDREGLEILAIYHSHPTSAAIPSRKDRERSYGAEVMSLIISMSSDPPEARGWWLTAESQREAEVKIDPEAD